MVSTEILKRGGVIYEMNIRQMTSEGSLRAAAEHLPQLRRLGVDGVWLMPIYPIGVAGRKGSLGSYYSIADYTAVNPEIGTAEDLDAFVGAAHELGMCVLLDWVANHTARDARWLREKPSEWYEREADGSAKVPFDWTDTAKLNYSNNDVWHAQVDAMRYWVEKHDVDGFRCDMAMLVPIEFWQFVRRELTAVRRDIFMLAEAEEDNLFDAAFDSCYGWRLHHTMKDVAQGRCRVTEVRRCVEEYMRRFPNGSLHLAFTSNHDENSWSGSEQSRFGAALDCMTALAFTLPMCQPLIYTGQVSDYDHSFAFFDRDPMPEFRPNARAVLYERLCAVRHRRVELQAGVNGGGYVELCNNAEDCLLTFVRQSGAGRVVVMANVSPYTVYADFDTMGYDGTYTDAVSGEEFVLKPHVGQHLAPWQFYLLEYK